MSRLTALATACLISLVATGCTKRVDHCRDARRSAGNAWRAYVAALERSEKEALATQRDARARITGDIGKRHEASAQHDADQHAARNTEAWSLAYRLAYDEACAHDEECRSWKEVDRAAETALADLGRRLPLARAALQAVSADALQASAAAKAVLADPEYPQLEQAQELSAAAGVSCTGSTPVPLSIPDYARKY